MKGQRKPCPFKVGTKLRYIGTLDMRVQRDGREPNSGWVEFRCGTEGTVTRCNTGYDGHYHDFGEGDGMEWVKPQHDWNTVTVDGVDLRAVDAESRKDWEVIR